MTAYERSLLLFAPVLPVLPAKVRGQLQHILKTKYDNKRIEILDVGGRRSPYTIGLNAEVTISDLPRETDVQVALNLGLTNGIQQQISQRRSNIKRIVLDDMVKSKLESQSFDAVVAIEVLEHVPEDGLFVGQVNRVLRDGGFFFMTTPNGEWVKNEPPNYNPDHVRHYRREQLTELLRRHFREIEVWYGVRTGKHRYRGLNLSPRHPWRTAVAGLNNVINHFESRDLAQQSRRTAHLFALAWK